MIPRHYFYPRLSQFISILQAHTCKQNCKNKKPRQRLKDMSWITHYRALPRKEIKVPQVFIKDMEPNKLQQQQAVTGQFPQKKGTSLTQIIAYT